MKRLLLSLTLFLAIPLLAQDKVTTVQDSLSLNLDLDNLRKITIRDGNIIASYSDGITRQMPLSGTEKLQLTTTSESEIEASSKPVYTIYDLSGRVVQSNKDSKTDEPFDLSGLSSGIYLLRTDNRTIKIVR